MPLDARFFNLMDKTNTLSAYSAVGHCAVLKSLVTGKNLACVQFLYHDTRSMFPMIVQMRNSENRFQVLFPFDDTNENNSARPFEIVITNLCNNGMIKIDFMKDDKPVDKVDDPTRGLNQVNELHPFQSYKIEADQTNKNRRIMTEIATKKVGSEKKTITVEEESNSTEKIGNYLYLTVTCQTGNKELEDNFIQTDWFTPDFVIVEEKNTFGRFGDEREHIREERCEMYFNDDSSDLEDYDPNDSDDYGSSNSDGDKTQICLSKNRATSRSFGGVKCSMQTERHLSNTTAVEQSLSLSDQINRSKVAKMTYGDQVLVRSGFTGKLYRYDIPSPMFTVGMSFISQDFCKKQTLSKESATASIVEYLEVVEKIKNDRYKEELKRIKTYVNDMCVICMEDNMESGLMFFRCGHICTCSKECAVSLDSCPMCRVTIVSKIPRSIAESF